MADATRYPHAILHRRRLRMLTLLIIILLIVLFSGGGYYGRRANWGTRGYSGLVLLVVAVILAVWALNELLLPTLPMPQGVAPINK
jgi:hypothetical protein